MGERGLIPVPTVVGVFATVEAAARAVEALRDAGFGADEIGFAWRDPTHGQDEPATADEGETPARGLGIGALVGGLIGGVASLLAPGVGAVIVGGILGTDAAAGVTTAAAAAGAALGRPGSRLTALGISPRDADFYQAKLAADRALVVVRSQGRSGKALELLSLLGAEAESAGGEPPAQPDPDAEAAG